MYIYDVNTFIYVFLYVHMCVYVYVRVLILFVHKYVYMYTYIYIYVWMRGAKGDAIKGPSSGHTALYWSNFRTSMVPDLWATLLVKDC